MIEKKIAAGDARAEFATLINEVAFAKTRTVLTRRGRDIAAIVPIEDFNLIRRLEDKIDSEKLAARETSQPPRLTHLPNALDSNHRPSGRRQGSENLHAVQ